MPTLTLTLEELWAIQQLVRETDNLGEEWDKDDMKRIHGAILTLIGQQPNTTEDLEASDGLLWQIENQVPQSLDLGRSNLGRSILLKVFTAIQSMEEVYEEPIPDVFRNAYSGEDDTEPYDSAGTESESRGSVPAAADGTTGQD